MQYEHSVKLNVPPLSKEEAEILLGEQKYIVVYQGSFASRKDYMRFYMRAKRKLKDHFGGVRKIRAKKPRFHLYYKGEDFH